VLNPPRLRHRSWDAWPLFEGGPSSAGLSAYYGAINDDVFHIGVMDKILMHSFPNTLITPAGKAFIDTVPGAVILREQSPLGTAAGDPQDGFNEASAMDFLSDVHLWARAQEFEDLRPLIVSQFNC
jgi:hypothetical protein